MASDYSPPVDQLLSFGDCRNSMAEWPNYVELLGLEPAHIPELIRMLTDEELWTLDSEDVRVWANIHAWRSLGQLRAEEAIEPLLDLLHWIDDEYNDWVGEEVPEVLGMIGAAAIPAVSAYLADTSHALWSRTAAAGALMEIGKRHPEVRDQCVAAIANQLEKFAKNNPILNGMMVANLVDLKGVEAAPVIERAFAANRVDDTIMGDWNDVQVRLELVPYLELRQRQFEASQRPVVDFSTVAKPKQEVSGFGSSSADKSKKKGKKKK